MLGQIINEAFNIELGMDTYTHTYFVNDRINHKVLWFDTLSQARNHFEREVDYRKRLQRMKGY